MSKCKPESRSRQQDQLDLTSLIIICLVPFSRSKLILLHIGVSHDVPRKNNYYDNYFTTEKLGKASF